MMLPAVLLKCFYRMFTKYSYIRIAPNSPKFPFHQSSHSNQLSANNGVIYILYKLYNTEECIKNTRYFGEVAFKLAIIF